MRGNWEWRIDGGIPYKQHKMDPFKDYSLNFSDFPGQVYAHYWFGSHVEYFEQTFETHVMCLEGKEKGATYGGFQWSHSFRLKPEIGWPSSVDDYDVIRQAFPINGAPSQTFIDIVSPALF